MAPYMCSCVLEPGQWDSCQHLTKARLCLTTYLQWSALVFGFLVELYTLTYDYNELQIVRSIFILQWSTEYQTLCP
jgi:hypothetical protein